MLIHPSAPLASRRENPFALRRDAVARRSGEKGEKYEAILNAAIKVFAEAGYHGAQVSRIAREAGVADGTIYLYFSGKADLLVSVFRSYLSRHVERLRAVLAEESDVPAKLRRLVWEHFRPLSEHYELAVVTQVELRQADPALRGRINEILRSYLDVIDGLIEEGKAAGIFRRDIETHLMRKMIFGTLDETVTSWVMARRRRDLMRLADPVFRLLYTGLKAPEAEPGGVERDERSGAERRSQDEDRRPHEADV
ncbi:MAG: TetR/AcrR family transcriptional regulator [Hydrogenibacillus schlegelii]|nr:TetR/AcrR family transcriptional regulator [Hydrogenibacillus schlegelii]